MLIRTIDLVLSLSFILILFPILLAVFLIAKLDTGSPIFSQTRLGKNKDEFSLYKFRSMEVGTRNVPTHEVNSASITIFGSIMRKYKIDELPQLFNVLRGDMSLVGPRPCLPTQNDVINAREKNGVFIVKPGITGLAQLNKIDMSTPKELAETDQEMIESLSLFMYLSYIFKTIIGGGRGDRIRKTKI